MFARLIYFAHEFLFVHYQTNPKDEFDNARIETSAQILAYQQMRHCVYSIIHTYLFYLSNHQYLLLTDIPKLTIAPSIIG